MTVWGMPAGIIREWRRTMRKAACCLLLVAMVSSVAEARIWTSSSGNARIEAEYVGFESGKVKLRFARSGKEVSMALESLSPDDQKFVEQARTENRINSVAADADQFTKAIAQDPSKHEPYILRGMMRINKGNADGALADFQEALKLSPNNADALNGRGKALSKLGKVVDAHKDFNAAIEQNKELPSAYRNRADNLRKIARSPESVPELDEEIERFGRNMHFAYSSNTKKTPWQPLNSTAGPTTPNMVLRHMAKFDLDKARDLELAGYGGGGVGGYGIGGYGVGVGGPGIGIGGPGYGIGILQAGLKIYPEQVVKGEIVTLVADPEELVKGMPSVVKPGKRGTGNAFDASAGNGIEAVDFYRDANNDGQLNPATDVLLATDEDSSDGFSAEVSTAAFPLGPQNYFAVPKAAEGTGEPTDAEKQAAAQLKMTETLLSKAAKLERNVAKRATTAAAGGGLSAEEGEKLSDYQDRANEMVEEAQEKLASAYPELSEKLNDAKPPIGGAKDEIGQSNPEGAAEKAEAAADKLDELAKALGEEAKESAGKGRAAGAPAAAPGEVVPPQSAKGGPGGPGGPGEGGPGEGGPSEGGDNTTEDGDDTYIDGDDTYIDGDDTYVDDDDLFVDEDDALDYVREGDYDEARVVYDRLVAREPNNDYYLRRRAGTLVQTGGYDLAVRDYDRLIATKPNADLYYNRGCAHLAAGRIDSAIADFSKSIELNETWSLAWNNRGSAYARQGDYVKAIANFDAAIKIDSNDRLAYRNRGLAYKRLGETVKAEADFTKVKSLDGE
jgi:tetratricopeptide (TPR) repeat protein